jgi:hypothetical protein
LTVISHTHTVNEIKNEFGEMRLQVSIISRVIRQGERFISFTKHQKWLWAHRVPYSMGTKGTVPVGREVSGFVSFTPPHPNAFLEYTGKTFVVH